MRPGQRSLNLSNAVAVAVFEAWRQHGYAGGGWPEFSSRCVASRDISCHIARSGVDAAFQHLDHGLR